MAWIRERKLVLARKARKADTNYIHAQLLLAGQDVLRDEIKGTSHLYYFDCGCVRSYSVTGATATESISACEKHIALVGPQPRQGT
jgi:hypothetical protein